MTLTTEAKRELVVRHLPLADKLARRAAPRFAGSVEHGDLLSGAFMGLMDAAERYDPSAHAVKFTTFAAHRIKGGIIDEARRMSERSRGEVQSVRAVEDIKAAHYAATGDRLMDDEVDLPETGSDGRPLSMAHARAGRKVARLDNMRMEDGKRIDMPAPSTPEPSDTLEALTRRLTRRERAVIVMYYRDGVSMADIGKAIGLCESRVSQIHDDLLKRLKGHPEVHRLTEGMTVRAVPIPPGKPRRKGECRARPAKAFNTAPIRPETEVVDCAGCGLPMWKRPGGKCDGCGPNRFTERAA